MVLLALLWFLAPDVGMLRHMERKISYSKNELAVAVAGSLHIGEEHQR